MKKIGIIGTRRRNTGMALKVIEDKLREVYTEGDWIVSGGCEKGGDRFAEILAKKYGIPILIFFPNTIKYKKAAFHIRNGPIAENSDVIIACVIRPEEGLDEVLKRKKGGTEDTLKKFNQKNPKGRVYLV